MLILKSVGVMGYNVIYSTGMWIKRMIMCSCFPCRFVSKTNKKETDYEEKEEKEAQGD